MFLTWISKYEYEFIRQKRGEEDNPGTGKMCKYMKIFPLAFKLSEDESAFGFITLASSALSTLPCTNKSLLCSEYMKNETCKKNSGKFREQMWLDHVGGDGNR